MSFWSTSRKNSLMIDEGIVPAEHKTTIMEVCCSIRVFRRVNTQESSKKPSNNDIWDASLLDSMENNRSSVQQAVQKTVFKPQARVPET
jgi:hypothetical protein